MTKNVVGYTIYQINGHEEQGVMDAGHDVMLANLKALWDTVSPGTRFERVRVFWPRIYTDMFVDEHGIAKGLKANYKATRIYRNNVIYHQKIKSVEEMAEMDAVYGVALLFHQPIWY